jgi:hypothetical protein
VSYFSKGVTYFCEKVCDTNNDYSKISNCRLSTCTSTVAAAGFYTLKRRKRKRRLKLFSLSPGGGPQIYVTWFALTSFIIPLLALSFYYARICVRIRQNLRSKEMDKERSMKKPTPATPPTQKASRRRRERDVVVTSPGWLFI